MRFFRSPRFFLVLLVFVMVHIALLLVYGVRNFYDSAIYIKSADYLLRNGALEEIYHIFYFVPISLIVLTRALFPGEVIPFLLLQIVISGFAVVCLYKASEKIFQSKVAALIAALTFLCWWDNVHWNSSVMTESVFCSLICFLIYRLVVFDNRRADWSYVSVLCLLLVFTRPTGIIVVIAVGAFILYYYWRSMSPLLKPAIIGCCFILAVLGAYVMFSIWDFTDQYNKGNVITYADVAEEKQLNYEGLRVDADDIQPVHSRDHSLVKMICFAFSNPLHFLKAAGMKIGYLLSATRPYYSWQHNFFSVTWLVLVYALSCFGYRNIRNVPLKFCIVAIILLNCALVGISSVDWDNRFYIPMYPFFALLVGGGGAVLINRIKSRRV